MHKKLTRRISENTGGSLADRVKYEFMRSLDFTCEILSDLRSFW